MNTTSPRTIALALFAASALACANMPAGLSSMFQQTEHHESSSVETEESSLSVNDEEIEHERTERRRSRRRQTVAEKEISDIGSTCKKNDECQARACWVAHGNLGYCTKMCNSWTDCPTHWKCKKPGNAPQKICMQD